ncbi:unnamed protein product [Rotaria sp. Silwood2]|nr:unnamed protein product [Rotaria sp. Silwood2]CAF3031276.1 unnamed protein product [Rotaria sp. Silwood2]CAF4060768.1 unnamed protein product [Rotaria sp. Silwood2]CAF4070815.1 unnamed protein product [Rotaria sp. Silwood2]
MSTPTISTVAYISQQIVRYFGIPIFVAGVIGAILSTTVLFSLQTFRQNSCAFYLALMSIFDLSELITSLLSFIMINGFGIDWTQNSIVYCKVRLYSIQVFGLIAKNYLCLATIDQFLATTTTRPQWQQWCTVKLARRLCLACGLLWAIVGIPFIIYYDLIKSSLTGKLTCVITSNNFLQYYNTFHSMFVQSCLFVITTGIFGLLAYRNIQQSSHQVLPIIRRGLAKQLTSNFHGLAQLLTPLSLDVLALQEALHITESSDTTFNTHSDLNLLSKLLQLRYVTFGAAARDAFGNALLSQYQMLAIQCEDQFSKGNDATIYVIHLDHMKEQFRLTQINEFEKHVQDSDGFQLVVGDFNSLTFDDYSDEYFDTNIRKIRDQNSWETPYNLVINEMKENVYRDCWREMNK